MLKEEGYEGNSFVLTITPKGCFIWEVCISDQRGVHTTLGLVEMVSRDTQRWITHSLLLRKWRVGGEDLGCSSNQPSIIYR